VSNILLGAAFSNPCRRSAGAGKQGEPNPIFSGIMGTSISTVCSSDCCSRDTIDQFLLHAKDMNLNEHLQGAVRLAPTSKELTGAWLAPKSRELAGTKQGCRPPISREVTGTRRVAFETPRLLASSAATSAFPTPGDRSEDENCEPQLPPGDDYNTSDEGEQKKEQKQEVEWEEEVEMEGRSFEDESAGREGTEASKGRTRNKIHSCQVGDTRRLGAAKVRGRGGP